MKKSLVLCFMVMLGISLHAQCVVVVHLNVNFSLDSNGEGKLYAELFDNGSFNNCALEVALYNANNDMELVPYGDTIQINCDHLGDLKFRVRDANSGNFTWGNIFITDMLDVCTSSTDNIDTSLTSTFSNGILDVELPAGIFTEIHVYNLVGKLMYTKNIHANDSSVDLTTLDKKGIYIVSAMINKKIRSKKIVVW